MGRHPASARGGRAAPPGVCAPRRRSPPVDGSSSDEPEQRPHRLRHAPPALGAQGAERDRRRRRGPRHPHARRDQRHHGRDLREVLLDHPADPPAPHDQERAPRRSRGGLAAPVRRSERDRVRDPAEGASATPHPASARAGRGGRGRRRRRGVVAVRRRHGHRRVGRARARARAPRRHPGAARDRDAAERVREERDVPRAVRGAGRRHARLDPRGGPRREGRRTRLVLGGGATDEPRRHRDLRERHHGRGQGPNVRGTPDRTDDPRPRRRHRRPRGPPPGAGPRAGGHLAARADVRLRRGELAGGERELPRADRPAGRHREARPRRAARGRRIRYPLGADHDRRAEASRHRDPPQRRLPADRRPRDLPRAGDRRRAPRLGDRLRARPFRAHVAADPPREREPVPDGVHADQGERRDLRLRGLFAVLVGGGASLFPAWRASKVEPVDVLRGQM